MYLAMVPDIQAIANPPKTSRKRSSALGLFLSAQTPKTTAHTTANAMLYTQ